MKKLCSLLLLAFLLVSACLAEINPLPLDTFDGGPAYKSSAMHINKNGVSTYEDDTLSVKVWNETMKFDDDEGNHSVFFWIADVKITDPSQMRSGIGGDVRMPRSRSMWGMANHVNAVIAVNADFYMMRNGSYTVKQSTVLNPYNRDDVDMLIIDNSGDFHLFTHAESEEALKQYEGNTYQCFCFGPNLVRDGELVEDLLHTGNTVHGETRQPRTAIGQLEPLHYVLVVAEGRNAHSGGITMDRLASYMQSLGCVQAYNLDGGASSMMYMGGNIMNNLTDEGERYIGDILYFVSLDGQ